MTGQNGKGGVTKAALEAAQSRHWSELTPRLLVVDDNRICRETLVDMLGEQRWIGSVDGAPDGRSALSQSVEFPPTITLLNMATEDAVEWLGAFVRSKARVVCLGVRERETEIVAYAEAGAAGYVLRHDSLDSLRHAVEGVLADELPCSPGVAGALLRRVAALAAERRGDHGLGRLTAREVEVLALIERGLANREIAAQLFIELRTVKNHVHRILEKLEVDRRGQAAALMRAGPPLRR